MSLHHTQDQICPLCESKKDQAHPTLQYWFERIKGEFPDAHLSWTFRGEEDQNRFYDEGKTRCRWPNSAHNQLPSRAMDLFQIRSDRVPAWQEAWFKRISAWLESQNAPLEWGGNWKSLGDGDHFELRKDQV